MESLRQVILSFMNMELLHVRHIPKYVENLTVLVIDPRVSDISFDQQFLALLIVIFKYIFNQIRALKFTKLRVL